MSTLIHQFVAECQAGTLERCIKRMKSGWAVLGDPQVIEGYCLLYPDPVVPDLNSLSGESRAQFLSDMASIGDAVLKLTAAKRINYEILGNVEPALHAHVIPRFTSEPDHLRTKPIWFYDWEAGTKFNAEDHQQLLLNLRGLL